MEEACSLCSDQAEQACFIAGGTDLLVQLKASDIPALAQASAGLAELVIDVTELPELRGIGRENGVLRIGAAATWSAVVGSEAVRESALAVLEAARTLGSVQVRNMATVGGNICHASPAADLVPPLLALDASLVVASASGTRVVPLHGFALGVNRTVLAAGELLVEIRLPAPEERSGCSFMKFGRTASDIAIVNAATTVELDSDGVCRDARIAMGAVGPTPMRAEGAEELLRGERLSDDLLEEAGRLAARATQCITDVRASAAYRQEVARVLVKRALEEAWRRARLNGDIQR